MIKRIRRVTLSCAPALIAICLMTMVLETGAQERRGRRGGFQRRGARAGEQVSVAPQTIPTDLKPLLTPRESEMRIVAQHYNADRRAMDSFYNDPLSSQRLAKLKRFDIQWADALSRLNVRRLSEDAQNELQALNNTIAENLAELEAQAQADAQLAPLVTFASAILEVLDARRRVEVMDAEKTAGKLNELIKQVAELQAKLESGKLNTTEKGMNNCADAVEALNGKLRSWYNFYDAYDPMFSWWMPSPYNELALALEQYAATLREKAAVSTAGIVGAPTTARIVNPASAPAVSYVPDLEKLLAIPQNEFRGVMAAYGGGGGRGRRGGGGAQRTDEFYNGWLKALKTLEFASLSRPAQVSYLSLRHDLEAASKRRVTPAQENIPSMLGEDTSGLRVQPPVGRTALMLDLADNLIAYTPEEVIAIGDAEYAWCINEMKRAARELGFGDDWPKAIEHAKTLHAPAGGQPKVIRDMMYAAVNFIRAYDLLTVPEVERETLRMGMMSPQRQLVNPFFTGGASISVSYPTNTMSHQAKLQSMRGNNIPFVLSTVHHELIPGHNMDGFISSRYNTYRSRGNSGGPFYSEGWCVYWEMLFYKMNYPKHAAEQGFATPSDPANRMGFLFWRAFRSARITFSLRYHMGEWTPAQCIEFLTSGVGHEPENARAEVLRSFNGSYPPLYQCAYLVGAVQLRMLAKEVVESGKLSAKDFHDTIIQTGGMPFSLIRLLVNGEELSPDMKLDWKFYGDSIPALPPDLK